MNNRDTLLSAQFAPAITNDSFLELDLRDVYTNVLLGRRGQLQFMTKLVFKAEDEYRKDQSVFWLWADMRVQGQDGVPWDLGRARIPDPVFFGPASADRFASTHRDPWTRVVDRLTLDLDYRQLDEIEAKRQGGPLTFTFTVGGTVQHSGKIGLLYPANHQLTYDVSESEWIKLLGQLNYGTYMTIEVPLTSPNGLTGDVRKAALALAQAQAAFLRGDYEEAVADCRPGVEALLDTDKGKFNLNPWDRAASKDERFHWTQKGLLSATHLAHHPNDVPSGDEAPAAKARWEHSDAEAVISLLAALIRWRVA
jgi:hypothetical protein